VLKILCEALAAKNRPPYVAAKRLGGKAISGDRSIQTLNLSI
jgi:hypothetical protein